MRPTVVIVVGHVEMTIGGVLIPVWIPERRIERHVVAGFRFGDSGLQFLRRPPEVRHRRLFDGRSILDGLVLKIRHIVCSSHGTPSRSLSGYFFSIEELSTVGRKMTIPTVPMDAPGLYFSQGCTLGPRAYK